MGISPNPAKDNYFVLPFVQDFYLPILAGNDGIIYVLFFVLHLYCIVKFRKPMKISKIGRIMENDK